MHVAYSHRSAHTRQLRLSSGAALAVGRVLVVSVARALRAPFYREEDVHRDAVGV